VIVVMPLSRRVLFRLATSATFERAVRAWPGGEARAWRSARRYIAGETLDEAVAAVRRLEAAGLGTSVDLFGERGTPAGAPAVVRAYEELCAALEPTAAWVSLDLSHIGFDAAALDAIAAAVPPGRRLQLGAEEHATADRVLDLALETFGRRRPIEATLQANLRRSGRDAERLAAAGISVRLVKGAYAERPADARPWGPETDAAYLALARRLLAAGVDVALATHDATLLAELPDVRREALLGISVAGATSRDVRVYVPYGRDWFRYFMRRRAEARGA
jgi:proline dehydrogenase